MRDDYTYHLNNSAILITSMVAIGCKVTVDPTIGMTLPKPVAQLLDQLLSDSLIENVYYTKYDHECQYNYIDVNLESYQSIIFLCNITCDIDMAAVIMTKSETCRYTLWHNNTYIGHSDVTDGIQLKLLKGDNYLCFVFNAPNFSPHLFVRCESLLFDKMKKYTSFTRDNYSGTRGKIALHDIHYRWNEKSYYAGILYSLNQVDIDIKQRVKVAVFDYHSLTKVDLCEVEFNKPFKIDLTLIPTSINPFPFYALRFEFEYVDDNDYGENFVDKFFAFAPLSECRDIIYNEAVRIINDASLLESTRLLIQYRLDEFKNIPDSASNIKLKLQWFVQDIYETRVGIYPTNEYKPGMNQIYYISKLDNKINLYAVYLPINYNKNRKYPVILHFSLNHFANITRWLHKYNYKSEVIIVNVTTKGVNLGSYVGEATINDVLEDFSHRFQQNIDHVSALGHSNGASATWLHAQLTPHLFSVIAPCAGNFNPHLIPNLHNIRVYNVVSDADKAFWDPVRTYESKFNSLRCYNLVNSEKMLHTHLAGIYFNQDMISVLSHTEIDEYPDEIHFNVLNNRHLKAYWLTIHSLERGSEYGQIDLRVINSQTIEIECNNITGVTCNLPPYMSNADITMYVNKQKLIFTNKHSNIVSIIKMYRNGEEIFDFGAQNSEDFCIYRGNGISDVFLKPVRIINCNDRSKEMCHSAAQFSSPNTYTYDPITQVEYPIYDLKSIDYSELDHCSLVILDSNIDAPLPQYFRAQGSIQTTRSGFVYNNVYREGPYCVMQIISHPCDPTCAVLYINSNDERLYNRNIFTRKLILPSYCEKHTFLNSAAIVLYRGKYWTVDDYGNALIEK